VVDNNEREFIKLYLEMLCKYPKDMAHEYQQITGIVWAVPDYGYTVYKNVGIAAYNGDFEIPFTSVFPRFASFMDKRVSVVFWLRPALWLMLSLLLLFASSGRHGAKGLLIISPMLANAVMFLAGTPAQNVRYFYCSFTIFIIILVFSFMKKEKGKKPAEERK
jgi:hypothetical protein